MNISTKLGLRVMSVAVGLLGLSVASKAQLVLDNFDEYTNNQVLATATAASVAGSPWGRFGAATADNPIAKAGLGLGSSVAMDYVLNYTAGNNANLVYYFSTPGTNLTSVPELSFSLSISNISGTYASNTLVEVAVEETNTVDTIYQTTFANAEVLTNTSYQTFAFGLNSTVMSLANGSGSLDLTQVKDVRIRFVNGNGSGSQTIYVDNFDAIPEPSAFALIGLSLGLGTFVIRRRRR
jgi:hypothetical protein